MPMAYSDSNFHTQNGKLFADAVTKATGGELTIVVHGGGSLFKGGEIKRAVQTGQAPIGERLMSALANENPMFGIDAVPFLATDFAAAKKLYTASRPTIEGILDKQGLKLLYAVPWPPQGLYANKELNSVADMKGLKFRAYNPATARLAELTGAVPTQIEAAELSQALATGVANSFISSGATGVDRKVWEHLSHFYNVQAWLPKNMVIVNKKAWGSISHKSQDAVLKAAADAEAAGWAMSAKLAGGYLKTLAKNGMKVQPANASFKAELEKIGATMTSEWQAKAGAEGASVVNAFQGM
jgi:TRAP-type C4-dicarboxylate transport system substrate-binding protein